MSEAVSLKVSDVDSSRMVLRVEQGKGQRDRYVMLSPRLLEILRDWWRIGRPTPFLFPGHKGRPITRHAVEAACQKAHAACGIDKPITPHALRHYSEFGTRPSNALRGVISSSDGAAGAA